MNRHYSALFFVFSFIFLFSFAYHSNDAHALEGSPSIVINEFSSASGIEWVELLNTREEEVNLNGYTLSELTNPQGIPSEVVLLNLSGVIPTQGVMVFEVSGLNNLGDSISLYSGDISSNPSDLMQRVTYGVVTGHDEGTNIHDTPDSNQSVVLSSGEWFITDTPSKGWFNDTDGLGLPPSLSSINQNLEDTGITSNLTELDNPSETPASEDGGALYFEVAGTGKLVFTQSLNLSEARILTVLQNIQDDIDLSEAFAAFNSNVADEMNLTGATIYMYGLNDLGFTGVPDMVVKTDRGDVISSDSSGYPVESGSLNFNSAVNGGQFSFDVSHFTSFAAEVSDTISPTVKWAYIADGNTVNIGFSEEVEGDCDAFSNLTIVGESGSRNINGCEFNSDIAIVTFDGEVVRHGNSASIDINFSGPYVNDLAGNVLETVRNLHAIDGQILPDAVYVDDDWTGSANSEDHIWGYDAFSSVYDAVNGVAENGDVHIAGGLYDETYTVYVGSAITVTGPGKDSDTPAIINNIDCKKVLDIGGDDATIQGLFFTQESEGEYCGSFPVIRIFDATNVTITDSDIAGGYRGIQIRNDNAIENTVANYITNNNIHENDSGVSISGSTYNIITGNEIQNNYGEGIIFRTGNDGDAYYMSGNIVSDNHIYDNLTGIYFTQEMTAGLDSPVQITSNIIETNGCQGIYIGSSVTGISILDNDINDNGSGCYETGIYANSYDNIAIHNNTISGNDHGVIFELDDDITTLLNTSRNYWGTTDGPGVLTGEEGTTGGSGNPVNNTVLFEPFYINEERSILSDNSAVPVHDVSRVTFSVRDNEDTSSIDVSDLVGDSEDGVTGEIPEIDIHASTTDGDILVHIPVNTIVTGESGWDGTIHAPQLRGKDTISIPADTNTVSTVDSVVEIGFTDTRLEFSNAVRILLAGKSDKLVGYSRNNVFTEITTTCNADSQIVGNSLVTGGDCKIGVGNDLVVWTKHFTTFVTYTNSSNISSNIPSSVVSSGSHSGRRVRTNGCTDNDVNNLDEKEYKNDGSCDFFQTGKVLGIATSVSDYSVALQPTVWELPGQPISLEKRLSILTQIVDILDKLIEIQRQLDKLRQAS